MNWKDILKNVITQGRVKEIEDINIDIEDDDCNRELQQLANKLKNIKLLLEQTWDRGWDEDLYRLHPEVNDTDVVDADRDAVLNAERHKDPDSHRFFINDKESNIAIVSERLFYSYNPVPEEVACKALEMLKLERTDKYEMEVGGRVYEIASYYENKVEDGMDIDMVNSINISVDGKKLEDGFRIGGESLVTIEWAASFINIEKYSNPYFAEYLEYLDVKRLSEWDKTSEYGLTWHR
tara:strand:- start:2195 stop:2905 length:711 start_codon:yes stop_codon:yes gene_type:complete